MSAGEGEAEAPFRREVELKLTSCGEAVMLRKGEHEKGGTGGHEIGDMLQFKR